jgi:hypothetical protein
MNAVLERTSATGALRTSIAALIALIAVAATSVAGQVRPRAVDAAARPRFKAVAFDYLVLFDANSVRDVTAPLRDVEREWPRPRRLSQNDGECGL